MACDLKACVIYLGLPFMCEHRHLHCPPVTLTKLNFCEYLLASVRSKECGILFPLCVSVFLIDAIYL